MVVPWRVVNAALDGDLDTYIAAKRKDPNEVDENGWPLLLHAAQHGRANVVAYLLERGADADCGGVDSYETGFGKHSFSNFALGTAFPFPGSPGSTERRRGFVRWSFFSALACPPRYEGPLQKAATYGHHDCALLLLRAGADIEGRGSWTPLMNAAYSGEKDMLRLLLHRGASLAAADDVGRDAETLARDYASHNKGDPTTAAFLREIANSGGWRRYVALPRKRLLALWTTRDRSPDARSGDDTLLERTFGLPKGVFWLVLGFWRCDRDSPFR
jgi:hypothetical protein